MMARENSRSLTGLGRVAQVGAVVILCYWGLYALVAPVTNYDSQTYNLARLALAERGGFFGNPYWTSVWQVMHPWAFDAVHLPFLRLGFGYAIPSFVCLLGLCVIVLRMVRATAGGEAGWPAVLGLLALPCLVYQATSTKNDLAVVFFVAVWLFARWRWRTEARPRHLFWMVLAIGCLAGAKITGLMYAAVCSVWTLSELYRDRRSMAAVIGGIAVSVGLFGSIETYVECQRNFGHALGPEQLVRQMSNRDGLRGGLANLSRYTAGSLYVGQSEWIPSSRAIAAIAKAEHGVLARANLVDAGTSTMCPDRALFFFQSGFEELSGFGPLGTAGLAIMLVALLRWRPQAIWWQLVIGACAGLLLLSLTVGFAIWNNRYLVGHFTLTTIAGVFLLWGGDGWCRLWLRRGFVGLALVLALAAPLVSFNRTPAALARAVTDRATFETCMVPVIGMVRTRLHELRANAPGCRIVVGANYDSPVLPYLTDEVLETNFLAPENLPELLQSGRLKLGDIVVLDNAVTAPQLERVAVVSAPNVMNLAANGTLPPVNRFIYRYRSE